MSDELAIQHAANAHPVGTFFAFGNDVYIVSAPHKIAVRVTGAALARDLNDYIEAVRVLGDELAVYAMGYTSTRDWRRYVSQTVLNNPIAAKALDDGAPR